MESAKRRREHRKEKKCEQIENWRLQLGIEGSIENYEENLYYILSKGMELKGMQCGLE